MKFFDKIQYVDMNTPIQIQSQQEKELVFVSAFFNIQRSHWKKYQRPIDYYIQSFVTFLDLYTKSSYPMIVYLDQRYLQHPLIQKYISHPNLRWIPIDENWLYENILSWKKLEVAKKIMSSLHYKNLLQHRIQQEYPENIYAEYNMINHAKIDFIKHAIDHRFIQPHQFVCWTDFGYFYSVYSDHRFPKKVIDVRYFDTQRMNFFLRNKIDFEDQNSIYTAIFAKDLFTGGVFGGPVPLLQEFHSLYHECLDELHQGQISDDDQHVYLRCFLKRPNMFHLFLSIGKWPEVYSALQKK